MILQMPKIFPTGPSGPAAPRIYLGQQRLEATAIYGALASLSVTAPRKGPATGTMVLTCYRDERGRWPVIDDGYFERWMPLRIDVDFESFAQHLVTGFVLKMTPEFPEDRSEAKLTVEFQDETAMLDRQQIERVWPGDDRGQPVTDRFVLSAILAGYAQGFRIASSTAEGQTSATLNQAKTDFAFLTERADASAFEFRIRDREAYLGPPQLTGTPQPVITVYAGASSNAQEFKAEDSADTPAAALAASVEGGQDNVENIRLQPDLPLLGDQALPNGQGVPDYELRVQPQGDAAATNLRALAQGQINEASLAIKAEVTIDGTLYGHVLLAGALVEVDGVGSRYGGRWYVDSVEHDMDAEGYRQKAVLLRNAIGQTGP